MPDQFTTLSINRRTISSSVWVLLITIALALTLLPQPAQAALGTFWDDDGSTHEADIEAIAAEGITRGCGQGKFCPLDPVTRGEMAAFLHRALDGRVERGTATNFTDTSSSRFASDIAWLSATGITRGCDPNRFCPDDPVTREQMAAFLRRALEGVLPAGDQIAFSDISSSTFSADIAWLSATGVTKGCATNRFCPRDLVTRDQMASFLTRALGLEPIQPVPVLPNAVRVSPGENLQSLVNSHPSGTVFVLETGTHSRQSVTPKQGNRFVGEPGAILDGENSTRRAFAGHVSNVIVEGLVIRNYANPAQSGALEQGTGWIVRNNEIAYNSGGGVRAYNDWTVANNNIHHNGQIGILANGKNITIIGNEIAYNNTDGYDPHWEAGGTKFHGRATVNLVVKNNYSHHNNGAGLWTDWTGDNTLYEGNRSIANAGPGIFHEASGSAVIKNNIVENNGDGSPFKHWVNGAGILLNSSRNTLIVGNQVLNNNDGIGLVESFREPGLRNITIKNNTVTLRSNALNGAVSVNNQDAGNMGSWSINFNGNHYQGGGGQNFAWGGSNITWNQWRAAGQDGNGTLD